MSNLRKSLGGFLFLLIASSTSLAAVEDWKAKEYDELKKDVTTYHAEFYFGPDKPWLFDTSTAESYPKTFIQSHCQALLAKDRPNGELKCTQMLKQAVLEKLAETYFTADLGAVNKTCMTEALICGDLITLEGLFRRLHNAGIEESKREKLSRLDEWREGKLSDDQLKNSLHIEFKFKNSSS